MTVEKPCPQCPWRLTNQGKRTPWRFFTFANLKRLWDQIRGGGRAQSCHLTDPSHPDHIAAGASEGATVKECPGSVILVLREVEKIKKLAGDKPIGPAHCDEYLEKNKNGLIKTGLLYWLLSRISLGHLPLVGDGVLPEVDIHDSEIGLPKKLTEAT